MKRRGANKAAIRVPRDAKSFRHAVILGSVANYDLQFLLNSYSSQGPRFPLRHAVFAGAAKAIRRDTTDLSRNCGVGKFVVSGTGEGYDSPAMAPNRKFRF
jgi:hypothetical protein